MTQSNLNRALATMLIVGPILTAVNQWEALATGQIAWLKLGLTFLVPFCVSLSSSYLTQRSMTQSTDETPD